jgi:hypothetical protein
MNTMNTKSKMQMGRLTHQIWMSCETSKMSKAQMSQLVTMVP